jgi:hypothetical protein
MRTSILISMFLVGACNGNTMHVDNTPNQQMQAEDVNYPNGPYGYTQGSIIQDIVFLGKADPAGAAGNAAYASLPMKRISLGDYHNDTTVKYVVLSGVAGWCGPCNNEQAFVPDLQTKYEPLGFKFFEAMIQGYNEQTGTPATENDVNTWANAHTLHVGIGIDPEDKIHQYADITAFPLNMVVRTSDMNIVYMSVGEQNLDSTLASLP